MKALDNLENYDIPAGFRLTAEQEVQFASDLKEIVHALIPIRGSKLHTRRYFNSHLRYTSNVQDYQKQSDSPQDTYEFGETYPVLPGEYTWHSDLLQPALLDVLREDMYSFGFVVNYIDADLQDRGNDHILCYRPISDAAIKFALAFDIDEIRAKAKSILDLNERLLFLNTKLTDYKLFDSLDRDEEEWLGTPVFQALQSLIEEAEKELKLAEAKAKSRLREQPQPNPLPRRTNQKLSKSQLKRDVLYDFTLCSLPQFASLRMEVHGGCLTEPDANEFAFSATVRDMFARCYDVDNKLQKSEAYFEEYPRFVYAMMERYAAYIEQAYRSDPRTGLRLMFEWLIKTRDIIEENYQAFPTLYLTSDRASKKDPRTWQSKDTWPVKLNTYTFLYRYFRYRVETLLPEMPESLSEIIPYNMWIGEYDALKEKYSGKLGLEFRKRAVVNAEDNKKRFFEVLVEQCTTFCLQNTAENPMMSPEDIYRHCDEPMTALIHSYFQDYIDRLQAQSEVAPDIDAAILNWIVSTLHETFETYAVNQGKILRKCGRTSAVDIASMRFYLDICERNILEIAHVYFEDSEKIPLVKQKPARQKAVQEPEPHPDQPALDVKPEAEQPKIQHTRRINYKKLYDAWNEKAFTATTLEEFTAAIDNADFSKMMERAENAGQRAGFIGAVKFIIKRLNQHLGSNWYYIACCSIGETPDDLNKLNDTTKQIGKIDTKILSGSIK